MSGKIPEPITKLLLSVPSQLPDDLNQIDRNGIVSTPSDETKNTQKRLGIIWPGFRYYNEALFRIITEDRRFKTSILWILKFQEDEVPPADILSSMHWRVVGTDSIRVSGYNLKTLIKMIFLVWRTVHESDGVLTSTQAPLHSKVAFACAKILKKKIFIKTEQWLDLERPSPLMKLYKKIDFYLMRNCDMLLPHGTNQLQFAASKGVSQSMMRLMPMLSKDLRGMKINNPALKKELGISEKKVILYFGRIIRQKGLKDLLLACVRIKKALGNTTVVVCGGVERHVSDFSDSVSYEGECRKLADAQLPGMVIFTGPIASSDKHNYFQLADLFVHPHGSKSSDGWGLVINEATSMALPVIVSDRVGSAPDLVVNGENGYIVGAGDVDELSRRIEELITDDEKRKFMAARSRSLFEKYHQPQQIPEILWEALHSKNCLDPTDSGLTRISHEHCVDFQKLPDIPTH